jgi:hypothetical protein
VVLLQAAVAGVSLEVMSSVRAYVAGEAMWSRSQKNAVYFLNLYLHSGEAELFRQYEASLAVPIGDEFARWALERDPVDPETARIGFLQGGNHPDDIPGMIWLFRHFSGISFFRAAIREWTDTDPMLLELNVFGEAIQAELKRGTTPEEARLQALSSRLSELNRQFTEHANRYSTVLGEGSRTIKLILTFVNITTAAILILLLVWHTRRLVLQRQSFEDALRAEKERLAWQASQDHGHPHHCRVCRECRDPGGRAQHRHRLCARLCDRSAAAVRCDVLRGRARAATTARGGVGGG